MKGAALTILAVVGVVLSLVLAGCAGSSPPPSPSVVSVTVSPGSPFVEQGGTVSFAANVTGSSDPKVVWSLKEGSAGGTISADGAYQAPAVPGNYHLIATSEADSTKSAEAIVTVLASDIGTSSSLAYPRLQHTATLLPSGKVLVVGGGYGPDIVDGYFIVAQAELFDPVTATFTGAGMDGRDDHIASLLPNGDVLLVGGETGYSSSPPFTSILSPIVELRKSDTGLFVPTGSMALGREAFTATLLNDGRMLIAGGLIPDGLSWQAVNEAEVYDPSSGIFTVVGKMNTEHACHTATLLQNGRVLITGGSYPTPAMSAELFNPVSGTFTATGSMNTSRSCHTATLLPSGKVLMVGGEKTGMAEIYDPVTGLFTPTGSLSVPRSLHTATLLPNGTALIAGGAGGTTVTEIYDPVTGTFTLGAPLAQGRFSHTATLLPDGRVVFIGGAVNSGNAKIAVLGSAEFYQ
jgi:hypothetical protein